MSWNWLRDNLQGRAFDLSEKARQDFHFYMDKSEKWVHYSSAPTLSHFLLNHQRFEQTQRIVHEWMKYSILLCPKSIQRVFTWSNLCHIVQTHTENPTPIWSQGPDVFVIKQGICFFLLQFSDVYLLWKLWKQRMWKTKTKKSLKHRIVSLFLIIASMEEPGWIFLYYKSDPITLLIKGIYSFPLLFSKQTPDYFWPYDPLNEGASPSPHLTSHNAPCFWSLTLLLLFSRHMMPFPSLHWLTFSFVCRPWLRCYPSWMSSMSFLLLHFKTILYEIQPNPVAYRLYRLFPSHSLAEDCKSLKAKNGQG